MAKQSELGTAGGIGVQEALEAEWAPEPFSRVGLGFPVP